MMAATVPLISAGTVGPDPTPLALAGVPPAVVQAGEPFAFNPGRTGGRAPFSFDLSAGSLAGTGLTLNPTTGFLEGDDPQEASVSVTIRCTDSRAPNPRVATLPVAFEIEGGEQTLWTPAAIPAGYEWAVLRGAGASGMTLNGVRIAAWDSISGSTSNLNGSWGTDSQRPEYREAGYNSTAAHIEGGHSPSGGHYRCDLATSIRPFINNVKAWVWLVVCRPITGNTSHPERVVMSSRFDAAAPSSEIFWSRDNSRLEGIVRRANGDAATTLSTASSSVPGGTQILAGLMCHSRTTGSGGAYGRMALGGLWGDPAALPSDGAATANVNTWGALFARGTANRFFQGQIGAVGVLAIPAAASVPEPGSTEFDELLAKFEGWLTRECIDGNGSLGGGPLHAGHPYKSVPPVL